MTFYNSYSSYLSRRYGYRIYRVGIDAFFSCPNRLRSPDGSGCVYCDSQGARAAYQRPSESAFTHGSQFMDNIDSMAQCPANSGVFSYTFDPQAIDAQVQRALEFLKRRYEAQHFAAYLQSFSNTFAPCDRLREVYDYVMGLHEWESFIVSTRPDCIDKEKLGLLRSYRKPGCPVCVELGLQSGDDAILAGMNRGHDVGCFLKGARMVKEAGLELCVHVLTGFPGEGKAELDRTIEAICISRPDALKIHNLNIVAGTHLYEDFLDGEVTAPCMTRHIASTVYMLRRIPESIVIERLMCETPEHRLASPRLFADKNTFLRALEREMERLGAVQGDLCQRQ